MKFVNLTPHDVVVQTNGGSMVTFPKSGTVARVVSEPVQGSDVVDENGNRFPVFSSKPGKVMGLPPSEPGTVFIVSVVVREKAHRTDVLSPDTGPTAIRDEKGQVVAVRGFIENYEWDEF